MRQLLLIICVFSLVPALAFSQVDKIKWLTEKIKNADTILLISHKLVEGSTDEFVDNKGNRITLPKLFVENRLNRDIVTEEKTITGKAVDSLIKILTRSSKSLTTSQGGCFVPKQSVIVIEGMQTSYIDLCFHCSSYETSKDLQNIPAFDRQRWTELKRYFRQQGLTYELDLKDN